LSNRRSFAPLVVLAALFAPISSSYAQAWEQIPLQGPIVYSMPDGSDRTLQPSCSGGPVRAKRGYKPADTRYSFFVQRGSSRKLLLAFDGGGACWNANTCVAAAAAGRATYSLAVTDTPENLARRGGALRSGDPRNPFRDYTKVFVPYCTADVHWGSKDASYSTRILGKKLSWTIRHRGTDNLLAVLDWLRRNGRAQYGVDLAGIEKLTIVGGSAGGYGAMLAFAYASKLSPQAEQTLVADASIGVLTADFYRTAIYSATNPAGTTWNVSDSLPGFMPGASTLLSNAAAAPNTLVPLWFQSLAQLNPDAHMASITTNQDLVQIEFYALMRGDLVPSLSAPGDWYQRMRAITLATAPLANYRYYVDKGTSHTVLASDEEFYGRDAHALSPAQWLAAMLGAGGPWDTLDAGPP
jgi:hypothetical protein